MIVLFLLIVGYVLWLFADDIQAKINAFRTEKAVEAAIAQHQPKKALALLEMAVTEHPKEALFHFQLATQYHQQKQHYFHPNLIFYYHLELLHFL